MITTTNIIIAILVLYAIVTIYKWLKKRKVMANLKDTLSTVGKSLKDGKITKVEAGEIIEKAKNIIDGG